MAWFAFLWNTWDERFVCHIRFYSTWTAKLLALLVINPMEARMIFKSQKILYGRNPLSEEYSLRISQPKFFNDIYTTRSLLNIFARPWRHHTLNFVSTIYPQRVNEEILQLLRKTSSRTELFDKHHSQKYNVFSLIDELYWISFLGLLVLGAQKKVN